MKKSLSILAAAVIGAVASTSVFAQTTTSPARADVKKEAAAEAKSDIVGSNLSGPEKTAAGVVKKDKAMSDTSRADVKSEAAATNTIKKPGAGQVSAAGDARPEKVMKDPGSRAEVKAEARQDNKTEKKIGTDLTVPEKKAEGVIKK